MLIVSAEKQRLQSASPANEHCSTRRLLFLPVYSCYILNINHPPPPLSLHTFSLSLTNHAQASLISTDAQKMSSQLQPPQTPLFHGFRHVFRCVDTLKSHLESFHHGLQLAVEHSQQQHQLPCQHTTARPLGPPPQYGLPPSTGKPPPPGPLPEISPALVPSSGRILPSATKSVQPLPHPHVYGHGYMQAQSFGGSGDDRPSDQDILAQINAAREGIGLANAELNLAIAALQREAEEICERYAVVLRS